MLTHLSWIEIAIRLGLATLAGVLVGYNREARSQAAGLRTTTLVCVSAAMSMVLANLMLTTELAEGAQDDIIRMDVLRLPLGVLTGIGFIGAGAIIRRDDVVVGVATAATLWFMTMVGLAFGAGQLVLGVSVTVGGLVMLWALEWADQNIHRRFRAMLHISAEQAALPEGELRQIIAGAGQCVLSWGVTYHDGGEIWEARAELEWRGHTQDRADSPAFLKELRLHPGVRRLEWSPQALSA